MDLYKSMTEAGIDCHLTYYRQLDDRIWDNGRIYAFDQSDGYYTRHDLNVMGLTGRSFSPRGGETRAVITMPSGREYVGVAMCSRSDNFSRRVGRNIALMRALQNAWADISKHIENHLGKTQTRTFIVDCNGICTSFWMDTRCPKHGRFDPRIFGGGETT